VNYRNGYREHRSDSRPGQAVPSHQRSAHILAVATTPACKAFRAAHSATRPWLLHVAHMRLMTARSGRLLHDTATDLARYTSHRSRGYVVMVDLRRLKRVVQTIIGKRSRALLLCYVVAPAQWIVLAILVRHAGALAKEGSC